MQQKKKSLADEERVVLQVCFRGDRALRDALVKEATGRGYTASGMVLQMVRVLLSRPRAERDRAVVP